MTNYEAANALIDHQKVFSHDFGWNTTVLDALDVAIKTLRDVRPVVRGKWKHMSGDEWCCSNCGYVISTEGSWEHPLHDREKFFCERCGADMREVEHE